MKIGEVLALVFSSIILCLIPCLAYSSELIASYEDGCELSDALAPLDVERVEIHKGSGASYLLKVYLCGTFKHPPLAIDFFILIDYDSDESTGSTVRSWSYDHYVYLNKTPRVYPGVDFWIAGMFDCSQLVLNKTPQECIFTECLVEPIGMELFLRRLKFKPFDRLELILPGTAVGLGVSRLAFDSRWDIVWERVENVSKVRFSELSDGGWFNLATDSYEGLPMDLKAVYAKLEGSNLLVRYEYYGEMFPIPETRSLVIYLPVILIGKAELNMRIDLPIQELVAAFALEDIEGLVPFEPSPSIREITPNSITIAINLSSIEVRTLEGEPLGKLEIGPNDVFSVKRGDWELRLTTWIMVPQEDWIVTSRDNENA